MRGISVKPAIRTLGAAGTRVKHGSFISCHRRREFTARGHQTDFLPRLLVGIDRAGPIMIRPMLNCPSGRRTRCNGALKCSWTRRAPVKSLWSPEGTADRCGKVPAHGCESRFFGCETRSRFISDNNGKGAVSRLNNATRATENG